MISLKIRNIFIEVLLSKLIKSTNNTLSVCVINCRRFDAFGIFIRRFLTINIVKTNTFKT